MVVAEDVRVKRVDADLACEGGELLEETRPDAMAVDGIRHRERDFCSIRSTGIPVVPGEGDNPSAGFGDQCCRRGAVQAYQCADPRLGERRPAVETVVQALLG